MIAKAVMGVRPFSGTPRPPMGFWHLRGVLQSSDNLNYGVPNDQALTVASFPGLSGYWAIFAYDTGAQMYSLAAPARRVGFFLPANSATDLTANGWLLFDAALAWLVK